MKSIPAGSCGFRQNRCSVSLTARVLSYVPDSRSGKTGGGRSFAVGDLIKVAVLWWSAEVVGELVVAPTLLTAPTLVRWWSRANCRRRIEGGRFSLTPAASTCCSPI